MPRRQLDLPDAEAVIAEVQRLRADGYQPLGRWNLGQICEHLTETIRWGMDPDARRLPWILRKLFTNRGVRKVLQTRTMPANNPTLKRLKPTSAPEADDPAKIDEYLALVAQVRDFQGPLPPFPLADGVSVEAWKQIQWIHAAHHLSFLEPRAETAAKA